MYVWYRLRRTREGSQRMVVGVKGDVVTTTLVYIHYIGLS